VRRDVVRRFVAAATSPNDRIGLRRTVGGGGETSGSRRGRDRTAAAALGSHPTVLRPTPNTLSVDGECDHTSNGREHKRRVGREACQRRLHRDCTADSGARCR